jgi:hypothetical protein
MASIVAVLIGGEAVGGAGSGENRGGADAGVSGDVPEASR